MYIFHKVCFKPPSPSSGPPPPPPPMSSNPLPPIISSTPPPQPSKDVPVKQKKSITNRAVGFLDQIVSFGGIKGLKQRKQRGSKEVARTEEPEGDKDILETAITKRRHDKGYSNSDEGIRNRLSEAIQYDSSDEEETEEM